jgi:hypothetical protein
VQDPLFFIPTPLGFSVRTTSFYWELILRKHPEVTGKESAIQNCLRKPEQVRRSKQDRTVYLFYASDPPYYIVVVAKRLNGEGFMITSYLSDKVKEGELVWPISV